MKPQTEQRVRAVVLRLSILPRVARRLRQKPPANTGFTPDQLQAVTQTITQAVQGEVKTIADAQEKLRTDFGQAAQPRGNGSQMFGAPGIRTGEDPMSSRGFQTARAMMMVKGELEPENCKVETDLSQKLADFYTKQGFARASQNSISFRWRRPRLP